MKKTTKIIALALVAVFVCLTFAACGKTISGEYAAEINIGVASTKTTYKFSGSKVTITNVTGAVGFEKTTTFEGKYEIKDDQITFTFEDDDASSYNQTVSFEKTDDGIKIGGVEYKKQ